MDVSVIVATWGERQWIRRAVPAIESAAAQAVHEVVPVHFGHNVAMARNIGATKARCEWLCFLDADDTLDDGYFEEMEKVDTDLRAPRLIMNDRGRIHEPYNLAARDWTETNPFVIGTLVRKSMWREVGGFDPQWDMYEDWEFFIKCILAGATFAHTDARYVQHVRRHSRNHAPRTQTIATYNAIRAKHLPDKEPILT